MSTSVQNNMESTVFIKEAKSLIEEIKMFNLVSMSYEEEQEKGSALQKRISNAISGLQNPTLPSAYKLRDESLRAGFYIDPKRQQWLDSFEDWRA